MKIHFITLLLFGFVLIAQGQELGDNQRKGYVIDNDQNRLEGIIEIKNSQPWANQRKISFIPMDKWTSGEKIKKKHKEKYTTKDIVEYGYDDTVFKKVKYKNVNAIAKSTGNSKLGRFNKISSGLKNAKSSYFAEMYQSGKISMYKFYNAPPDVSISSGEETEELKRMAEESRTNYDILVIKEGEGAKSFESVNIKKYFKDCSYVVDKFKDKQYTKKPSKKIKAMLKNSMLQGESLAAAAKEMIDDYNEQCN